MEVALARNAEYRARMMGLWAATRNQTRNPLCSVASENNPDSMGYGYLPPALGVFIVSFTELAERVFFSPQLGHTKSTVPGIPSTICTPPWLELILPCLGGLLGCLLGIAFYIPFLNFSRIHSQFRFGWRSPPPDTMGCGYFPPARGVSILSS